MGFDFFDQVWFGSISDVDERKAAHTSQAAATARIHGVCASPRTLQRLLELTASDPFDVVDVAAVVESDPAVAARTLHIANAISLADARQCHSIPAAVELVGRRRMHQMALGGSVSRPPFEHDERVERIHAHSVTVAEFCRELARPLQLPPDEMYVCGLLHDIGKLMLLSSEGQDYADMVHRCEGDGGALHMRERERYGFDHGILAGQLLADWLLPPPIVRAIAGHHDMASGSKTNAGARRLLVRLADRLARSVGANPDAEFFDHEAEAHDAAALGLSAAMLLGVWPARAVLTDVEIRSTAADGAPSLRPIRSKRPTMRVGAVPNEQPCSICGQPSMAATCPRCGSFLCSVHEPRRTPWCSRCEHGFKKSSGATARPGVVLGAVAAGGLSLAGALVVAGAPVGVAGTLAVCGWLTSAAVAGWLRWTSRSRFLREGVAARAGRTPSAELDLAALALYAGVKEPSLLCRVDDTPLFNATPYDGLHRKGSVVADA